MNVAGVSAESFRILAERVDLSLGGVWHRLVGPDLRQRRHLAAEILGELRQLLLEVAVLFAAAGGERKRAEASDQEVLHFFAAPFFAAWRCAASSSSSR